MSDIHDGLLFRGAVASGVTFYIPVPIRNGALGAFVSWPDSVSSATITLEMTSSPAGRSPAAAGTGNQWKDSGVSITGPAASALGSLLVNVENVRQKYARLKVVTAAATTLEVFDGTSHL